MDHSPVVWGGWPWTRWPASPTGPEGVDAVGDHAHQRVEHGQRDVVLANRRLEEPVVGGQDSVTCSSVSSMTSKRPTIDSSPSAVKQARCQPLRVRLLEEAGADLPRRDLRGDGEHGPAAAVRVLRALHEVGVAGAAATGAHRQPAG